MNLANQQENPENANFVEAEIRAAVDRFMKIFKQGNAQKIAETYSSNPLVGAPFGDLVRGQAQLLEFWKSVLNGPGMKLESYSVKDVQPLGDGFAAETTTFVAIIGGKRTEGKYLVIWKRENGQWKLHVDLFNVAPE